MNPATPTTTSSHLGSLQGGAYGAQTDLDRIAHDKNLTESEKVGELAKEFETMLFKQIIKGMQKSLEGSSMMPTKGPSSIYGDMMMDALAHSISQSSQLGLSKTFQEQITNKDVIEPKATESESEGSHNAKEVK